MDPVSVAGLVAAAVAAVSGVSAARAARETVTLTTRARREDQLLRLAQALIEVTIAAEDYPRGNLGAAAGRYEPFDEAQRQLKRAAALSIVGLGAEVSDPVIELLANDAWKHPNIAMFKAREALEKVNDEAEALARTEGGPWVGSLKRSDSS